MPPPLQKQQLSSYLCFILEFHTQFLFVCFKRTALLIWKPHISIPSSEEAYGACRTSCHHPHFTAEGPEAQRGYLTKGGRRLSDAVS